MADTFIIRTDSDTYYANLITGLDHNSNAVPKLIAGTYQHHATSHDEEITINFQTIAKATNGPDAADMISRVELVLDWVHVAQNDPTSQETLWLQKGADGQNVNQNIINSWNRQDQEHLQGATLGEQTAIISQWTFTMSPIAEAPDGAQTVTKTAASINAEAGTYNATAVSKGTAPARIKHLEVTTADTLRKFWFGIKRGNPSGFSPLLQSGGTTYADISGDTSATTGDVTCTFSVTASMVDRFRTTVNTSWADDDLAGTYLVLLRMRYSGATGTEARVRCAISHYRYDATAPEDQGHDVFIPGLTQSQIYEMGVFTFPPEGYRAARRDIDADLESLGFTIAAERISGTGNLICDNFYLVPWETNASLSGIQHESGDNTNLVQDEWGQTSAYVYDTTPVTIKTVQHALNNWEYPANIATFWVAVAERSLGSVSGTITVTLKLIPRYYGGNPD